MTLTRVDDVFGKHNASALFCDERARAVGSLPAWRFAPG